MLILVRVTSLQSRRSGSSRRLLPVAQLVSHVLQGRTRAVSISSRMPVCTLLLESLRSRSLAGLFYQLDCHSVVCLAHIIEEILNVADVGDIKLGFDMTGEIIGDGRAVRHSPGIFECHDD